MVKITQIGCMASKHMQESCALPHKRFVYNGDVMFCQSSSTRVAVKIV